MFLGDGSVPRSLCPRCGARGYLQRYRSGDRFVHGSSNIGPESYEYVTRTHDFILKGMVERGNTSFPASWTIVLLMDL